MDAGAALTAEAAASVSGCALPPAIFKALEELAHVPNERKTRRSKEAHWMPVEDAAARSLRRPRVLVEQVVQYIYRHVLPFELPGLRGVEWWVHSRAPTEKMHVRPTRLLVPHLNMRIKAHAIFGEGRGLCRGWPRAG